MSNQASDIEELRKRLDHLEKQNLRYRQVAIALLVVVGAASLVAARTQLQGDLEAEKIVLRNRLAAAEAQQQKAAQAESITLRGRDGKRRLELNANGPHIKFFDEKGTERTVLFTDHLKFFDDKHTELMVLFTDHLKFFDEKHRERLQLNGRGNYIQLSGSGTFIKMFDESGVERMALFHEFIKFFDDKHTERMALFRDFMKFFDEKHREVMKLP